MCTESVLKAILDQMVVIYKRQFNDDVYEIYLYGSYARGDYSEESDIDIVAIVKGDRVELQKKLKEIWDISADIGLEYEVIISPTVIPYQEFEDYKNILPYYKNILQEGVKLSA